MKNHERIQVEEEARRRLVKLRLQFGVIELMRSKWKLVFIMAYLLLLVAFSKIIVGFYFEGVGIISDLGNLSLRLSFLMISIIGFMYLLTLIGTPIESKKVQNSIIRIDIKNSAGERPIYLGRYSSEKNPDIEILEFESNGVSILEFDAKRIELGRLLGRVIIRPEYGKKDRRILLYTMPLNVSLPKKLFWKEEYLRKENFELVLGESHSGRETVNLAVSPHLLLGGSSGSGKSILLKMLLFQCMKKNAVVCIADFKGGIDFAPVWHEKCNIVTDKTGLLESLNEIVGELERRKNILLEAGFSCIDDFNEISINKLQRVIFACDEVAEVLDKTGLSKEEKELVFQIESKLSTIARVGRALNINLILSTQRPDATILSGQIKNNIDNRVCGRADKVLSQIILDDISASEKIPKESQGFFITNSGVEFQGYLFDESAL